MAVIYQRARNVSSPHTFTRQKHGTQHGGLTVESDELNSGIGKSQAAAVGANCELISVSGGVIIKKGPPRSKVALNKLPFDQTKIVTPEIGVTIPVPNVSLDTVIEERVVEVALFRGSPRSPI